ncbi:MAG: hypothetical protein WCI74_03685 [Actinomycetes bacterium]
MTTVENAQSSDPRRSGRGLPAEDPLDAVSRLLADADSGVSAQAALERDAEVSDRIAVIWGRQSLLDRLASSIGAQVTCEVIAGSSSTPVVGELAEVGASWVHIRTEAGSSYFNAPALVSVSGLTREGLGRQPVGAGGPDLLRQSGWTQLLRSLADDRRRITVTTADGGQRSGLVGRVGADHFDLVSAVPTCLVFAALSVVRVRS